MLVSLHVRNMALIREEEVSFGPGLNILTGETGAGKSIIIGSVNVALGADGFKDYITDGEETALVELVFETDDAGILKVMQEQDIPVEDGQIIITRKYQNARTINRVNGEAVSQKFIREIASYLIDIHGQHEHQSLLYPKFHRELLDKYASEALGDLPAAYQQAFAAYRNTLKELEAASIDEASRAKQIDLLSYEIREIEEAALTPGEDEELEREFRRMSHGQKILEALSETGQLCGPDGEAPDLIGRAVRLLGSVSDLDEKLQQLCDQLSQTEDLLNDFGRDLADYMDDFSYDEQAFNDIGRRLDLINHLKSKYGKRIEDILGYGRECSEKLEQLQDHDAYIRKLQARAEKEKKNASDLASKISVIRREKAAALEEKITQALIDLNFIDVRFAVSFKETEELTVYGKDDICFVISVNPGMPLRPLSDVASGGELSRIMLAIKAVMADQDAVGTLIFDEIDTGISGRTAQKVSEKMAVIARSHQVICITHLAQIAAMADSHFEISKEASGGKTSTHIRPLGNEERVDELARILGGATITETVTGNAREMLALADKLKKHA